MMTALQSHLLTGEREGGREEGVEELAAGWSHVRWHEVMRSDYQLPISLCPLTTCGVSSAVVSALVWCLLWCCVVHAGEISLGFYRTSCERNWSDMTFSALTGLEATIRMKIWRKSPGRLSLSLGWAGQSDSTRKCFKFPIVETGECRVQWE